MIESSYWKDELLSVASEIEADQVVRRWSEKRAVLLERKIMVAMFCVRSLIERHKIADELCLKTFSVEACPKKHKRTTFINRHRVDELFDLEKPVEQKLPLAFLCNQIIHSYIIFLVRCKGRFTHLMVCSDFEKNRFLYTVSIEMIVTILREVGKNYPNQMISTYDSKKGDYVVSSKCVENDERLVAEIIAKAQRNKVV